MEAEHRRQNASSKSQGRSGKPKMLAPLSVPTECLEVMTMWNLQTGDFLTSDMLQSMRDTFNMLRDDACAWRLAAAKSLMNELADLPSVGKQLESVPIDIEEDEASEGVEEEKATDLRANSAVPQILQASAVSIVR